MLRGLGLCGALGAAGPWAAVGLGCKWGLGCCGALCRSQLEMQIGAWVLLGLGRCRAWDADSGLGAMGPGHGGARDADRCCAALGTVMFVCDADRCCGMQVLNLV